MTDVRTRRRAVANLSMMALALTVLLVVAVVLGVLTAREHTGPGPNVEAPRPAPAPPAPAADGGHWDVAAQHKLATRPMTTLPAAAAMPQRMTTRSPEGPPITTPQPDHEVQQWAPDGWPPTPEGALKRLESLDMVGLFGADPAAYAGVYRELSLPGAPPPESTGLHTLLTSMRSAAGLPATGQVTGLISRYEVTHGQIKGTTDDGRYVVACVLGQWDLEWEGQTVSRGIGDCQALRWTGQTWRISPGPLAAPAPSAWPGSEAAVEAGYRELN